MNTLFWHDLRVQYRNPQSWLMGIIFFVLFLSLFAIAMNGDPVKMQMMGPSIIWLAVLFSLLLNFGNMFQNDIDSGYYEQVRLSGISSVIIVISKLLASFATSVLPLLVAIPIACIGYQLSFSAAAAIILSILLGAPAILAYGIMAGAILAGQKNAGFLVTLLTLPFMVPVIIFALSGIQAYVDSGLWNLQFQALSGISLIALAIAIPAASSALTAYMD